MSHTRGQAEAEASSAINGYKTALKRNTWGYARPALESRLRQRYQQATVR